MNSGEIIKGIVGLFLSAVVVVGLLIALLIKYGTKFIFCKWKIQEMGVVRGGQRQDNYEGGPHK
jgi:hypothetical protein